MISHFLATSRPAPDPASTDETSAVPTRRFFLSSLLHKGFLKTGVTWGLLLPLLSACSLTGVYKERVTTSFEGRCAPKETALRSVPLTELTSSAQHTQQLAHPRQIPLEKIPIQGFSWRSVQAARLIGIAPLLKRMAALESEEGQNSQTRSFNC